MGKRGRGKDTAADYLVRQHRYTKMAFAGPLKRGIKELFGFTDNQLYTEEKEKIDKNWGVSPREVCQVVGTDVVRKLFPKLLLPDIGNNFWVFRANIWYEREIEKNPNLLVVWSDVRFQNEVDWILKNGGRVYKIERESLDKTGLVVGASQADLHASEVDMDKIRNHSGVIRNNGTLDDLYDDLDALMGIKRL